MVTYSQDSILFKSDIHDSPSVSIALQALNSIKMLAAESPRIETGGILVGHNVGKDIHISGASDPGPNAERSAGHCLRDTEYCRQFLSKSFAETQADYVGEWHSHVVKLKRLSNGDLNTLRGIFSDPDYDFPSFAIILVLVIEGYLTLNVYVAERVLIKRYFKLRLTELYRGEFPNQPVSSEQVLE
jgi:hypothetical protein